MIKKEFFGKLPDGSEVYAYTISNTSGSSVKILNYGAILSSVRVPDSDGKLDDVVCGFDTIEGYLNGGGSHGAVVGRFANRIANGTFKLGKTTYKLAKNENGINHLHGGIQGFSRRIWTAYYKDETANELKLTYLSLDGEEGYPGTLSVIVTYKFDEKDTLTLTYEAVTDKLTVLNLTNHAYFNLGGCASGSTLNHMLAIDSDNYTPTDENLIPTGMILPVKDTQYDFTEMRTILYPYDNNFMISKKAKGMCRAARLTDPVSGRIMIVSTDLPAVQLYNAIHMENPTPLRDGVEQKAFGGVCLETQFVPDSPNQPYFPTCILKPNFKFKHTTAFRFTTDPDALSEI